MKACVLAAGWLVLASCATPAVAQTHAALLTDQVHAVYQPPADAKHQAIHDALQERRILELLRTMLSPLRLPRPLTLEVRGCNGRTGAYYWGDRTTLCYEYVELIQRHAPKIGTPGGVARADAIVGAILDTILHEVGHAVIEMLEIPVLGREEDAADFFSAYILLQFAPEDAQRLIQGVAFMHASEAREDLQKPPTLNDYAGQHGLAAQRYYNLLCMAYGSDPNTFESAVSRGGLPRDRANGCVDEFALLKRAFQKLILPHVDEALLAKTRDEVRFNWGPLVPSSDGLDALPLAE